MYFLLLGSNWQRAQHIRQGVRAIAAVVDVTRCTQARRTRSERGERYLNAGMLVQTSMAYEQLHATLRAIEAQAGRVRDGERCALDIDIVAGIKGGTVLNVFKPSDLHRGYVKTILADLGISIAPLR